MYGEISPVLARAGTGEPAAILPDLPEQLASAERTRAPIVAQFVVTVLAVVLALQGDDEKASTVLACARSAGDVPWRSPGHYALYRHYGRLLHRRLGPERTARCRERGATMLLREVVALVRA